MVKNAGVGNEGSGKLGKETLMILGPAVGNYGLVLTQESAGGWVRRVQEVLASFGKLFHHVGRQYFVPNGIVDRVVQEETRCKIDKVAVCVGDVTSRSVGRSVGVVVVLFLGHAGIDGNGLLVVKDGKELRKYCCVLVACVVCL